MSETQDKNEVSEAEEANEAVVDEEETSAPTASETPENPDTQEGAPDQGDDFDARIAKLEEEMDDAALRIKLDQFEGPFEVLLYLIRSQELDIFDIPIMQVTEQYLRFLELLREENLDVASEFLVMAATLIQIKSKMILPLEVDDDEEDEEIEEEDPRLELVEKLLEYRKFRDLAEVLGDAHQNTADQFARRAKPKIEAADDEDDYLEVSLYDLIKAIRSILRFITEAAIHRVEAEGSSVEDKIERISSLLKEQESVTWAELFKDSKSRVELVCCLLAILELCRMRRIRAHQHQSFGDIRIFAHDPDEESPPPLEAPEELEADEVA